ncbi:BtpA/SgcQ family protein [Roseibacterium sp. SDUM158017]|uniref:BtpA/SgcQ family protein n=1 Tax=Roseicyclus salinarum TaxID=3036773 RepID=UPI00241502FD|nr:BtpA/SgcQ family protein [Roseibacterium sp. SDUM158017]MDG4650174.1 BtpA/SgcQ family protein [Roseibacterium sp. SDUM158017]
MSLTLFEKSKPVIAALHLPDFALNRHLSVSWYEDYAITNARIFAEAGIPWIKLQDQTRTQGAAAPDTLARMAALARLIRAEVPGVGLGIIVEAHDPSAALSVADAAGADFVRLKVFVGGAMTAQGPRSGLGAEAVAHRAALGRAGIALLADVHDRTAVPMSGESQPFAAEWAVKTGADGLVVTGSSFADTLQRIAAVRAAGVRRPVLIGGGVTEANVAEALTASDGVVVSSALMRRNAGPGDLKCWDPDLCRRFMDAVRVPA